MWDELDKYLSSTAILNLDLSSEHWNENKFGDSVTVEDKGMFSPPLLKIIPKFQIVSFGIPEQLIFIKCNKVHPIYEQCTIVLAHNSTQIRLSEFYYSGESVKYTIGSTISEREYDSCGEFDHFIDYKLYLKLRHFRNLYDVNYFGEKQ